MNRRTSDPYRLAPVVRALRRRRGELHDRLRDEVEAQVPDFRFTDAEAELRAERLRDDVIDGVLDAVRTGDVGDVSFNQELGRAMAEAGLPLAHHFTAHRVAYPLLLGALLEELDRQGRSEIAAVVARRHAAHASAVTEAYVLAYVEARAVAELDDERSLRSVVDGLLQAEDGWSPRLTNQAAILGVEPQTSVLALVLTWESLPARLSPELVRRRLQGWLSLSPCTPLLLAGAGIEGLAVPTGRPAAVVDTLRRSASRLSQDGVDGLRCGVSPLGPAREGSNLHRQATVAHRVARPSQPVVTLAEIDPIRYLASTSHPEARVVVSEGVRTLHGRRERGRPTSRQILDEWQLHGSVNRVAEALHCHPNTVLNRFRTMKETTGLDPRHPGNLLQLVCGLAILDHHGTRGPGAEEAGQSPRTYQT